MGTGCGPIGSLQSGYREGADYGVWGGGGKEEISHFQGSPEGVVFLLGACLCSLRLRMRVFHDLLKEKPLSIAHCLTNIYLIYMMF
jgi:hypothetical protein